MKEGGKTAVSAGTLKGILGFTAVGIRQERRCFLIYQLGDRADRRWIGVLVSVTSMCWTATKGRAIERGR